MDDNLLNLGLTPTQKKVRQIREALVPEVMRKTDYPSQAAMTGAAVAYLAGSITPLTIPAMADRIDVAAVRVAATEVEQAGERLMEALSLLSNRMGQGASDMSVAYNAAIGVYDAGNSLRRSAEDYEQSQIRTTGVVTLPNGQRLKLTEEQTASVRLYGETWR